MHLHRALSTCSCCTSSQETVREASSLLFHFHSDTNTTTTPHYQLPTATFGRTELKCLLTFPDLDPKPAQHFFAYSRKMGSKPQTPSPFALLPFRGGAPHPHPTPPHPTPPHPHPTPPHPTPPHPTPPHPHPTPITVAYVPRFGWAWGGGGEGRGGERRGGSGRVRAGMLGKRDFNLWWGPQAQACTLKAVTATAEPQNRRMQARQSEPPWATTELQFYG